MNLRSLVLFTTITLMGAASAQTLPGGVVKGASVEGITEYTLTSNGMKVLLAPDQSKPTTTVNLTYLVGSKHENYGETGMAHLLEHLIFKGTPTTKNALGEFSKRGIRANGSTWLDRTNYFGSFAANEASLQWYIGWQADAMVNSFIARKDLDSEMTVVRNEMEMGENSPFRILYEKMSATAYQWHNYGKSTIGARADVENVDIARLQAFYRNYYQPDNAVLVVSGEFNETKTLAWIAESFGKLQRPTRKLADTYTLDPTQDGERSVTVRRTGNTVLTGAMYHVPAAASTDAAAAAVVVQALSDAPSGRLHKALVETKLAASVFGLYWATREPGTVTFGAQLSPDTVVSKAQDALINSLETLNTTPITQEELARAKLQYLKDWELNYTNPEEVGVQLSEFIAQGDWRMMFLMRDRVKALTLADAQRFAVQYLVPSNRTLGTFLPSEKPVRAPAPAFVDAATQVKDYKGDANFKQAEAFDPTPANIDARTKTVKLNNGMTLVMLPKSTRGALVNGQLTLRFGAESSLVNKSEAAEMAAAMLLSGTDKTTRQQIADRFDALKATVNAGGGAEGAGYSFSVPREGVDGTLKLIAETARNANFPAKEFEEFRNSSLTQQQAQTKEPQPLGGNLLARHGNPHRKGDVRYVETFDESAASLKALKLEEVREFHKNFYGTDKAVLAMVGDFDAVAVEKLANEIFADWKAPQAYQRIARTLVTKPVAVLKVNTPDKANAYLWVQSSFALQDTSADFTAFSLANYLLGRSSSSRLWSRIRETEGLSYDVRSQPSVSSYEPVTEWTATAICAPQNLPKVRKAFDEEVARALKDGFTDTEVKQGIESLLSLRRLGRAQDAGLVGVLSTNVATNRDMKLAAQQDAQMSKLTTADVNAALRKYIKPETFVYVVAGSLDK